MKKLWLLLIPILFSACNRKIDQKLIRDMWNETVRITEISPETPMPEISSLDEDFYAEFLKNDCSIYSGNEKTGCEENLEELDQRFKEKTGKSYKEIYEKYFRLEKLPLNEECGRYDEAKRNQCEEDKQIIISTNSTILGRFYPNDNKIEIFPANIESVIWGLSYKEGSAYFYGVIAHEMLHSALRQKGIPMIDQHLIMKNQNYNDRMIDFISERLGAKKDGRHKEFLQRNLDIGINHNNAKKRIKERTQN